MKKIVIVLSVLAVSAIGAWVGLVYFKDKGAGRTTARQESGTGVAATGTGRAHGGSELARISPNTFDPDKELQANELLIVNPPPSFNDVARRLNYTVIERYTFQGLGFATIRVRIPAGMSLQAARQQLGSELPGATIDYNHRYDASQSGRRVGESGSAADQRKKGKITSLAQAALGWRDVPPTCGKGIKLGMIDSGVDLGHPALKGQDIEFRSFHGPDASPGDAEHGTAVAALLVGKPADSGLGGLLPGATLKAANMFERNAVGSNSGNAMALLRGLDWLIREHVSVINMSIAGGKNAAVEKGIAAAYEKGISVAAAAGNWGRADKPAYPAAIEQVFAVTAIDSYEGIYENANRGNYIDFAAPGVNVLTAVPGGGSQRQSGTSFAAPFITAILALEIANGRGGNPAALQSGLTRVARDLGPSGKDATYGAGLVQTRPQCPA